MTIINGTDLSDTIDASGLTGLLTIYAKDGDDLVFGGSGDDAIFGNGVELGDQQTTDRDTIYGGAGRDYIDGQGGNDLIYGGDDSDDIFGGAGNDRLFGDSGTDRIYGGYGSDRISGGTGNDYLNGGIGNDVIIGQTGNDELRGDGGNDLIYGGTGNDTIAGIDGKDTLYGGTGADTFRFGSVSAGDGIFGANNQDIIADLNWSTDHDLIELVDLDIYGVTDQYRGVWGLAYIEQQGNGVFVEVDPGPNAAGNATGKIFSFYVQNATEQDVYTSIVFGTII